MSDRLHILFFGLPAGVSAIVLDSLITAGIDIAGVILPASAVPHLLPESPPVVNHIEPHQSMVLPLTVVSPVYDTLRIAGAASLSMWAVTDFEHADALSTISAVAADVAVVACFTRRIPDPILKLPRFGFLNLHPSLLPDYRGPTPVFHQLRAGAAMGVTVHYMDEGLDTGDIAAQAAVPLPDGLSEAEVERLLMTKGAEMLIGVLGEVERGIVRRWPQPPGGSYLGFPAAGDFTLSTSWPARRAYNFMRGAAGRGMSFAIDVAGQTELLAAADHYEPELELGRPSVRHGRNILIRFNPGILYARLVR